MDSPREVAESAVNKSTDVEGLSSELPEQVNEGSAEPRFPGLQMSPSHGGVGRGCIPPIPGGYESVQDDDFSQYDDATVSQVNDMMLHSMHLHDDPPALFSRKIFIGGLPKHLSSACLVSFFKQYGECSIDWPHRQRGENMPPSGYAFILFSAAESVETLLAHCESDGERRYVFIEDTVIQIRVWRAADCEYVMSGFDQNMAIHFSRYSIFVGGVSRTITAEQLARALNDEIGDVVQATIEVDCETEYPKGAARIVFCSERAYVVAISKKKLVLNVTESLEDGREVREMKAVELKAYLEDCMMCEMCGVVTTRLFCAETRCLRYFCDRCWKSHHGREPALQAHHPMLKGANHDSPRPISKHASSSGPAKCTNGGGGTIGGGGSTRGGTMHFPKRGKPPALSFHHSGGGTSGGGTSSALRHHHPNHQLTPSPGPFSPPQRSGLRGGGPRTPPPTLSPMYQQPMSPRHYQTQTATLTSPSKNRGYLSMLRRQGLSGHFVATPAVPAGGGGPSSSFSSSSSRRMSPRAFRTAPGDDAASFSGFDFGAGALPTPLSANGYGGLLPGTNAAGYGPVGSRHSSTGGATSPLYSPRSPFENDTRNGYGTHKGSKPNFFKF